MKESFDVESYIDQTLDWAHSVMKEHVKAGNRQNAIAIGQEFIEWSGPGKKIVTMMRNS